MRRDTPYGNFEQDGPQLRGDFEEVEQSGIDRFQKVFLEHMLDAFHEFKIGRVNRFNPKRIQSKEAIEQFALGRILDLLGTDEWGELWEMKNLETL